MECLRKSTECCRRAIRNTLLKPCVVLKILAPGCAVPSAHAADVGEVAMPALELQPISDERAAVAFEHVVVNLQLDSAKVGPIQQSHEAERCGILLTELGEEVGLDHAG